MMERVQVRHKDGDFNMVKEALSCAGKEINASSARWSLPHADDTHW